MSENSYHTEILERLQYKIFAFSDDVRRQTQIFEGRRSIEEQLSEEYHGRFLIELIQNADDACGPNGRILIVFRPSPSPRLAVLNTGQGFTKKNFESLCTLGLTDKRPEEAIGNKGLGFRSVLEICKSPMIFSSDPDRPENSPPRFDGYCFCFSPAELATSWRTAIQRIFQSNDIPPFQISDTDLRLLESDQPDILRKFKNVLQNKDLLERACKILPAYEMPIPSPPLDQLLVWASSQDAATAVVLNIEQDAVEPLKRALSELNPYTFLFLRNAKNISIFVEKNGHKKPQHVIEFERTPPSQKDHRRLRKGSIKVSYHDRETWSDICGEAVAASDDIPQRWYFKRKHVKRAEFEKALKRLPERWHDMKYVDIEIGVPVGKKEIEEGRFAIYLPTKANTGTGK